MKIASIHQFADFLSEHQTPCLSLYQPTHRRFPENQQDPTRFRNLVRAVEDSLREESAAAGLPPLLEPLQSLIEDVDFWNHSLDGLAVFRAPDFFRVVRLQHPMPELAIAAPSFHLKPLLRATQSVYRFQILGLTANQIRLFEGNQETLDELQLEPGVPRTLEDALGSQLTAPHLIIRPHSLGPAGANPNARFGQGGRADELDLDRERFFRVVDRAVLEHHSKPTGLPLLLAALPEHQTHFRTQSHNPFLLEQRLELNPNAVGLEQLRQRAWQLLAPGFQAHLDGLIEQFGLARAKGLGGDDLPSVSRAAVAGRVGTLFIEEERHIPGRIDPETGGIEPGELSQPGTDDLLDDLAETVLKKSGQVVVVPRHVLPNSTGLAAIYRY